MAKVKIAIMLFVAIHGLIHIKVFGQLCRPCEEGKQCIISYNFNYENNRIMHLAWRSDSNEVVTCYMSEDIQCFIYPQYKQFISFSAQKEAVSVTTNLIFINTSRLSKSFSINRKWNLLAYYETSAPKIVFSCDVKILRKPSDIKCSYDAVKQGLQIKCIGVMLYPEMECTFSITSLKHESTHYISSVYNNTEVYQDPVYYNSTCFVKIPCELLGNEFIMFDVIFFPKSIQYSEYVQCRRNYSCPFILDNLNAHLKIYSITNEDGRVINISCKLDNLNDRKSSTLVTGFNTTESNKMIITTNAGFKLLISTVIYVKIIIFIFIAIGCILFNRRRRIKESDYERLLCFIQLNDLTEQLATRFQDCTSNHKRMILCKEFIKKPSKYLKKYQLDSYHTEQYILSWITLTVKLKVIPSNSNLSDSASDNVHVKTKETIGSGIVTKIEITSNIFSKPRCLVYIATSTKIVSGIEDFNSATAELFYHDKNKTGVKTLKGVGLYDRSVEGDSCILVCETNDEKLYQEIKETLRKQKQHYMGLKCIENAVVLISHPHGLPKCISFVSCQNEETKSQSMFTLSRIKYDTVACPGCEGAPVLKLNNTFKQRFTNNLVVDYPVHLGINSNKVNFCGFTTMHINSNNGDVKQILSQSSNEPGEVQSDLMEVQMTSLNGAVLESSTIMHIGGCLKNSLHDRFIQIKDFTISKLPHKYQDQIVFGYINIISELTGRVDIFFTSPNRPDVDTSTYTKYPGWDTKNTRNMRTGTGTVVSVIEVRDEACPCPDCKDSPSKVFYLVYVLTAKHVVFDDDEARQSYFRIYFNTDNSPTDRLYGLRVVESDMSDGRCLAEFVTHESKFGIPLSDLLRTLYKTEKKIPEKFCAPAENKLVVIVSHPHGEPKYVTIGEWVERELISTPTGVKARYFYTTGTCQGSSGAAVIVLGDMLPRVVKLLIPPHIHHTTDSSGLGVSCFGIEGYSVKYKKT